MSAPASRCPHLTLTAALLFAICRFAHKRVFSLMKDASSDLARAFVELEDPSKEKVAAPRLVQYSLTAVMTSPISPACVRS